MVKLAAKLDASKAQLQLKVTLREIRPAIWRRLLVPARIKLSTLHAVLQHAFGWTDSHLHAFRIGHDSYEAYYPESWDEWPGGPQKHDESKYRLCDLLHAKGDKLRYLYDFGDGWEHDVRLEKILPSPNPASITCLAGERSAPPEDCGGVPGYYNLVEAMANPRNPEHRSLLEWLGEPFLPEHIHLPAISRALGQIKT